MAGTGVLTGKTALVTGIGTGLGRASTLTLAAEGARVVGTELPDRLDRAEATIAEVRAAGGEGKALPLNVLDMAQIDECVKETVAFSGRIDILVNNAGLNIPKRAFEVTEADWDAVLDVNLKGVFFVAQAVGRVMREQSPQGGCVINMASQMGLVGYFDRAAYCSSKAGVVNLTRVLAIEWAEFGIRANAVCPTFVETPLTRPMFEKSEAFREDVLNRILLRRLATPEEIAAAVVFLASPGAAMVNGHPLPVDGGWTAI